jgi:hypothetical protein
MLKKLATFALVGAALFAVGCGGSDDSASEEDRQALTELVDELNRVTSEKDAAGFCEVMQPSQIEETFHSKARCVSETENILKQAGKQPVLSIEDIQVDGDRAEVQFAGRAGAAIFVKEDGKWYVPFSTGDAEPEESADQTSYVPDDADGPSPFEEARSSAHGAG